ncbi:MAG: hypothetical protein ABEJ70_00255 [Halobacteriaceae archaeon]
MRRRVLLRRLGALSAVGLAGCAGRSSGSPEGPDDGTTTTRDGTTTTTTRDGTTTTTGETATSVSPGGGRRPDPWEAPDGAVATMAVGTADDVLLPDLNRPHVVRVWNATGEARRVGFSLRRDDTTVASADREFPRDGVYEVTVVDPAHYRLDVSVDGELRSTVDLPATLFDCEGSTTTVRVADRVEHHTTSSADCPAPVVVDHSLVGGRPRCGERDDATVSRDGTTLSIAGHLRAPTPCHVPVLADAAMAEDELVLTVAPEPDGSDVCVECVGTLPYDASVTVAEDLPASLAVRHRTAGDARTVARWTRDGHTTTG